MFYNNLVALILRYEQTLEVSIVESAQEAIAYGWLSAEPLPFTNYELF